MITFNNGVNVLGPLKVKKDEPCITAYYLTPSAKGTSVKIEFFFVISLYNVFMWSIVLNMLNKF